MTQRADEVIADLAARQHGIVAREQLFSAAGLTRRMVDYRVRAKRLRPIHRGVYAVGPSVSRHGVTMAAVLACGRGAALSHLSAASLWQMLPDYGASRPVDVTVPVRDRGHRPGIRLHRVRALPEDEVAAYDGIPATSPARTLLDLASVTRGRKLEQAVAVAARRQLTGREGLYVLLDRYPKRPGARALRVLLDQGTQLAMTRSEAEELLLDLVTRAGLDRPQTNVWVAGYEVDFFWPKQRFVGEVDGFAFRSSAEAFEGDRRKDSKLTAAGYRVQRVTWKQMRKEPLAVVARLAQALTTG